MKKSFLLTCTTLLLLTIAQSCFAYKISTSGKTITIKMKHPTIGIVGINQVDWEDNPTDIEKDIYDLFKGPLDSQKTGNYTIKVYWQKEDHYGNTSSAYAGSFSISADELKKYRDYRYARSYLNLGDRLYDLAYNNSQSTWSTDTSSQEEDEDGGWNWTAIIIIIFVVWFLYDVFK